MDWTMLKDVGLLLAGLFASRFLKLGDTQNVAAIQQATFGTRLVAAEEWIRTNSDIQSVARELKKDIETLRSGFDRLEEALRELAQSISMGKDKYAQSQSEAAVRKENAQALPSDVLAGLAMLSRLGKSNR